MELFWPKRKQMASKDLHLAIELGLFVHNVLLDELFLRLPEVEMVHFGLKHVPSFLTLTLICFQLAVARLNVSLRTFCFLFHLLGDVPVASLLFLRCGSSCSRFVTLLRRWLPLILRLLIPG